MGLTPPSGAGGGGGVTDHGDLTGLGDDDHAQYHNNTRGDARYQPLDADLTAIAAVAAQTAYGRAFLALVDAAAARTALALGTAATHAHGDYEVAGASAAAQAASQPLDADLTAIAAVASQTAFGRALLAVADASALQTAAGMSTFVKTLMDDADAATARATLGAAPLAAIACRLTKSADQTVNATVTAAVTFDGEAFDPSGLHDNSTDNSRITNTTGGTLKFLVGGAVQFNTARVGQAYFQVNGTTAIPGGARSVVDISGLIAPSTVISLANGDYVELMVVNGDGGGNTMVVRGSATPSQVHASFWATAIGT